MQRIKYEKWGKELKVTIYDIYANKIYVSVEILERLICIEIKKIGGNQLEKEFQTQSLQNAKRKVRKILKEEFEVNLDDEVRSKLCI